MRLRICKETLRSITLRIEKYLKLASDVEISPFDAVALLDKEYGRGVFSKVPMMRSLWNDRRAAARNVYMKNVMVLQRAILVGLATSLPSPAFLSYFHLLSAHDSARNTSAA